jgi:hypothetical protein
MFRVWVNSYYQRLTQKRAELQAQEQQLTRERGGLSQQFEAESNALYEASKHVRTFSVQSAAAAAAADVCLLLLTPWACERAAAASGCCKAGSRREQSQTAGAFARHPASKYAVILQITIQITVQITMQMNVVSCASLTRHRLAQALVAEWEQAQAEGGPKSLSAGD